MACGYVLALVILLFQYPSTVISLPSGATLGPSKELSYARDYFYVGGQYADDGRGTGEHIFKSQMYVERLAPVNFQGPLKPHPIIFIHGNYQTGTNFLIKPDGNPGWASFFISQGYIVYIVDQPFRGRSPWKPDNGILVTGSAELIQQRFTAPEDYNLWPQARHHTQWPGSGKMGDSIFDAFYASNVQSLGNASYQQSSTQAAGVALLDRLHDQGVILLAHSQGGIMPWLIADKRPQQIQAIIALEPSGPPFQDAIFSTNPARAYGLADAPLTYDPPVTNPALELVKNVSFTQAGGNFTCFLQASSTPPRRLANLERVPVLLITAEASYHAPYDWCTVEYLLQAGVQTEHLYLPDAGIKGNGHVMFLEKNSDDIAQVVVDWIEGRS
ncbi:MAG: hypothetical protein Q9173_004702 [Seirophora scorigena]